MEDSLDAHFIPHVKSSPGWQKRQKLVEEDIVESKTLLTGIEKEFSTKAEAFRES